MPSFPALVAVGTSVWLLERALGFRTETLAPLVEPSGQDALGFARCDYAGPLGGPAFSFSQNLAGYQRKKQKCDFICRSKINEFNTHTIKKIFATEFRSHEAAGGAAAYCTCKAYGGSRTLITFKDNRLENCEPSECWRKYLLALNFNYGHEVHVSKDTIQSSCLECRTAEECADANSLVSIEDLAKGLLESGADGEVGAFRKQMQVEGVFLDGVRGSVVHAASSATAAPGPASSTTAAPGPASSTTAAPGLGMPSVYSAPPPDVGRASLEDASLVHHRADLVEFSTKAPCDPKAGPFPRQCLVVPGPSGDEWACQLHEQGCAGNQFLVQGPEGQAVAITVFSVQNVVGEDEVQGIPFTSNFKVRAIDRGEVSIGLEDAQRNVQPLDYAVSGAQSQPVLEYTQELTLKFTGDDVVVTQLKPEQVKRNSASAGAYSYSHKPVASNVLHVAKLEPPMFGEGCAPNWIDLEGKGQASYRPPYEMP